MVQEIRSLKKTSHFFQGLALGRKGAGGGGGGGGGGGACTRYFPWELVVNIYERRNI